MKDGNGDDVLETAIFIAPVEDVGNVEDEVVEIEDDYLEEETQPIRMANDPKQPTVQEYEAHRCTHQPYRSWCKWCVQGRCRGQPHKPSQTGSTTPRICMDYFFITQGA